MIVAVCLNILWLLWCTGSSIQPKNSLVKLLYYIICEYDWVIYEEHTAIMIVVIIGKVKCEKLVLRLLHSGRDKYHINTYYKDGLPYKWIITHMTMINKLTEMNCLYWNKDLGDWAMQICRLVNCFVDVAQRRQLWLCVSKNATVMQDRLNNK